MGKQKAPRRVAENEALSVGGQIRGSAQKLNLVASLIRGKKAGDALNILSFSPKAMAKDVRKVLASFPERGMGIVATVPAADGVDIAGSATYVIGNDPAICEFAITVASDFGGVGLASTLLAALIGAAKSRGLTEMDGYVLAANHPMLRLARRLGFSVAPDPEDGNVRICRLRLDA